MDPRNDPNLKPPVDEARRRLAKTGLAAPAVLGVLASRPVLGASLHHCTPSGHISGFASPNPGATPPCSTLGHPPSYYRASKANWPGGAGGPFLNSDGSSRLFKDAPAGLGTFHGRPVLFADAYEIQDRTGRVRDATIWDVLAGCAVNESTGSCVYGQVLAVKSGYHTDLDLPKEAIAAAMNALTGYPTSFPIPIQQVVEMFNSVVVIGGLYQVTSTHTWNKDEVKAYLRSLHS